MVRCPDVPADGMEHSGVSMADRSSSGFVSADIFAARRRRLLLAAGAVTLTSALAPRLLLSRPADDRALLQLERHVDRVRAAGQRAPSYPLDRPLYYVRDASKAVALTIDDGPDPLYTPQVLDVLHHHQVTATFSMIGVHVAAYPELAWSVAAAGHQIANHTWTHANLVTMPSPAMHAELVLASRAIHAATGLRPGLFRAPYGAWSPAVIRQCQHLEMIPLDWSVDPRDWTRPGTRSIIHNILENTRPGSIILEHDGGGNRSQTVAALRIVIPALLHEGYHFVTP
jgi:peptidoglycan-N-acetylglucosamine deacetylase